MNKTATEAAWHRDWNDDDRGPLRTCHAQHARDVQLDDLGKICKDIAYALSPYHSQYVDHSVYHDPVFALPRDHPMLEDDDDGTGFAPMFQAESIVTSVATNTTNMNDLPRPSGAKEFAYS
jgi:hypothetical protein